MALRRLLLKRVFLPKPPLLFVEEPQLVHTAEQVRECLDQELQRRGEGIVLKLPNSFYFLGVR